MAGGSIEVCESFYTIILCDNIASVAKEMFGSVAQLV